MRVFQVTSAQKNSGHSPGRVPDRRNVTVVSFIGICGGVGATSLTPQGACALSRLRRLQLGYVEGIRCRGHQDRTKHNSIINEATLLE
jgi:hypothetical protein